MISLKELLTFEDPINDKLRIHLSNGPIGNITNKDPYFGRPTAKPSGFWYGFGREWIDWVYGEEFRSKYGTHIYFVKVKNPSRIFKLHDKQGMSDFSDKYGSNGYIDWGKVGQDWGGIEINPYQGKLYYDSGKFSWYGTWDIASGCVWDVSLIDIKQIYPKEQKS